MTVRSRTMDNFTKVAVMRAMKHRYGAVRETFNDHKQQSVWAGTMSSSGFADCFRFNARVPLCSYTGTWSLTEFDIASSIRLRSPKVSAHSFLLPSKPRRAKSGRLPVVKHA